MGEYSQLACHDHLGFVGVDRAALLEEVDGGLVGIYEQQALSENVEVDKFACNIAARASKQIPHQSSDVAYSISA